MAVGGIDDLVKLVARLPGLGPRSARRAVLFLIKRRESLMVPLTKSLYDVASEIKTCNICSNIDVLDPCSICLNSKRDFSVICVVEDVADLWALERTSSYKGLYHVLGGTLSALDGVGPEDLSIASLLTRASSKDVDEIILATSATVDGQTTANYVAERLLSSKVKISKLAHGVPVGGELDYLDDGTLSAALKARRVI